MSYFFTVVAIILVLFAVLVLCRQNKTQETFENDTQRINGSFFEKAYTMNGIEKCAALQFASITASNIIETGRLRQWKPTLSHPMIKDVTSDREHAYCYYYADDDKQILHDTDTDTILAPVRDPMLGGACSIDPASGSMWSQFTTVIKDAFIDKEIDANHKIPYKKCVLKVALSNAPAKEQLWKYVEEESLMCKGALDAVQKEYNTYIDGMRKLHEENANFARDYGTRDALATKLRTCVAQSNELAENLIPNMARVTGELQGRILADRSNLDQAIQQIKTQQAQADQAWEKVISDIVLNTRTRDTLQQSIARIAEEAAKANSARNACRYQHKLLTDEAAKRRAVVDDLQSKYNTMEAKYNMCASDLETTNAGIAAMTIEQQALTENNKALKIKLEGCMKQKATVTFEEDAWRKKAISIREQYELCSKENARQQATYNGYVAQAKALTLEIEDIKLRCRMHESEFHKANLATSRKQAVTAIKSTHTYCANVSAMKAKKAALLDELCELNARVKAKANEPQPCGDEVQKKACCPYRVIAGAVVAVSYDCCGGFKADGPNLILYTSEATVNRVRDKFADGSYVGLEGFSNKLYRLVGTKRDRRNKEAAIGGLALGVALTAISGTGIALASTLGQIASDSSYGKDWIKVTTVHPSLGSLDDFKALRRSLVVVNNPPPEPFVPHPSASPDVQIGQGDQFC